MTATQRDSLTAARAAELIAAHTEEISAENPCERPLVSVCLITYNHVKYVRQALEGVYAQNVGFPIEVVIGDDGSNDGTTDIVLEYQRQHPDKTRVLLARENLGKHTGNGRLNWLRTLRAARGKYVALLEGDDSWTDAQKLQKQVNVLEGNLNASLCFHAVEYQFEDESRPSLRCPARAKPLSGVADVLGDHLVQTCSIVFRREHLPPIPEWVLNLAMADRSLCLLLAEAGDLAFIDEVMAIYRAHSGGVWWGTPSIYKARELLRMYEAFQVHLGEKWRQEISTQLIHLHREIALLSEQQSDPEVARIHFSRMFEAVLDRSSGHSPIADTLAQELLALLDEWPNRATGESIAQARESRLALVEQENASLRAHLRLFEQHPLLGPLLRVRRWVLAKADQLRVRTG
jgi:hypothetical protein